MTWISDKLYNFKDFKDTDVYENVDYGSQDATV